MKEELADEWNYTHEAASSMRSFGSLERLGANTCFKVLWGWEGSTPFKLPSARIHNVHVQ